MSLRTDREAREWMDRALAAETALEDLLDRQYDFPTNLSCDPEWAAAFDRARQVVADGNGTDA